MVARARDREDREIVQRFSVGADDAVLHQLWLDRPMPPGEHGILVCIIFIVPLAKSIHCISTDILREDV